MTSSALPKFLDQLFCADITDAGLAAFAGSELDVRIARARNVVNGVAHQGHDVSDFGGRDAHELFDFFLVDDEIALVGLRTRMSWVTSCSMSLSLVTM